MASVMSLITAYKYQGLLLARGLELSFETISYISKLPRSSLDNFKMKIKCVMNLEQMAGKD